MHIAPRLTETHISMIKNTVWVNNQERKWSTNNLNIYWIYTFMQLWFVGDFTPKFLEAQRLSIACPAPSIVQCSRLLSSTIALSAFGFLHVNSALGEFTEISFDFWGVVLYQEDQFDVLGLLFSKTWNLFVSVKKFQEI